MDRSQMFSFVKFEEQHLYNFERNTHLTLVSFHFLPILNSQIRILIFKFSLLNFQFPILTSHFSFSILIPHFFLQGSHYSISFFSSNLTSHFSISSFHLSISKSLFLFLTVQFSSYFVIRTLNCLNFHFVNFNSHFSNLNSHFSLVNYLFSNFFITYHLLLKIKWEIHIKFVHFSLKFLVLSDK